jgi:prepilin peptidase CpaA
MWQWALVAVLAIAVYTDWRWRRIYNWLTLPALLVGLVLSAVFGGWDAFLMSLAGAGTAFGVFLLLFLFGGMGGGDLKLMTAIGAWLGFPVILIDMIYVALAGGVLGIAFALQAGAMRQVLSNIYHFFAVALMPGVKPTEILTESAAPKFPYGLAIAAGTLLALAYPSLPRLAGG